MSTKTAVRLIEQFRAGWIETGDSHFNLEIHVPGSYSTEHPPFDMDEYELIATVCLPYTADRTSFTLDGFAVVQKRYAKASAIETFKWLCAEAGAAMPNAVRARLASYCPWNCSSPGSWWIALLADTRGITAYNSAGVYQDVLSIPRPWLLSIVLLESLDIDLESPLHGIGDESAREAMLENPTKDPSGASVTSKSDQVEDPKTESDALQVARLSRSESDILREITEAGCRLTTNQVIAALEKRNGAASIGTTKTTLAALVRRGLLTNRQDVVPRGYGLTEWG